MTTVLHYTGLPSLGREYLRAVTQTGRQRFSGELPDLRATANGVRLDPERLRAYRRICGMPAAPHLPVTYPQVLAAPLHAALLAHRSFPFQPLGIVHVAQRLDYRQPIDARSTLDLDVRLGDSRQVARGLEFDLETTVSVEGEPAWTSTTTILVRLKSGSKGERQESVPPPGDEPGRDRSVIWALPGDLGRRYAAVSGDYNPIHLHPLLARPFGFSRPIVHGMWSLARCLGEVADEWPAAPYRVEARFERPLFLPARVHFASQQTDEGLAFVLQKADGTKPYVQGWITTGNGPV